MNAQTLHPRTPFRGWRAGAGMIPALFILAIGVYALVYATGGVKYVYVHAMYLPIVLAGLAYGVRGGVPMALAAGILLGPPMPLDVAAGTAQETGNWLFRTLFFVLAGGFSGFGRDTLQEHLHHLRWLTVHDPASGLDNRMALLSTLRRHDADPDDHAPFVLGIVSVENSGELASAFGFEVIEDNIPAIAGRAAHHLPAGARLFRIATEQVCFLADAGTIDMAAVLPAMHDAFRQPFHYGEIPIHIDTRIGYVNSNDAGGTAFSCVRKAEAALLLASERDHETAAYHAGIRRQARDNLALLGDLVGGLERGEVHLHYQPKVCIGSGEVCGVEALMRWQHHARGRIPPGAFIPRAEQSTLIHSLTEFAVEQALAQAVAWQAEGLHLPVAVNISPRNLQRPGFADMILTMVARSGASPELLELEVTEGVLMGDMERIVGQLQHLVDHGVRLAIDDFGAGYSSLNYVHRLPASFLKIDQSFIARLLDDGDRDSPVDIIEAIVSVARKKGIRTVAEGIECRATFELLRDLGCDIAQGFAIGRPMAAGEVRGWHDAWCSRPHLLALPEAA